MDQDRKDPGILAKSTYQTYNIVHREQSRSIDVKDRFKKSEIQKSRN